MTSDSGFVAPGAIPWLLLQVVGARPGPNGGNELTKTTFIQRVHTSGGGAPATGCASPADVNTKALVPYSADYVFWASKGGLISDAISTGRSGPPENNMPIGQAASESLFGGGHEIYLALYAMCTVVDANG